MDYRNFWSLSWKHFERINKIEHEQSDKFSRVSIDEMKIVTEPLIFMDDVLCCVSKTQYDDEWQISWLKNELKFKRHIKLSNNHVLCKKSELWKIQSRSFFSCVKKPPYFFVLTHLNWQIWNFVSQSFSTHQVCIERCGWIKMKEEKVW